jgi:hypothetical protein
MEKVILEALPLVGPPGAMALVVIYYFMRQQKAESRPEALDDVRSQISTVRHILEENRATIRQVRDDIIVIKDRTERG